MNYRHAYHAGNFADIFKHLILAISLDYLKNKEKGFFILDAFGGTGLYDLYSDQAQRTQEYTGGISAFMNVGFSDPDLARFQAFLRPYWQGNLYPGSPQIAAEYLRPQDRLLANELHPEDVKTLRQTLSACKNAKALHMDAYESIRANIPPAERRGLVLIDPPFERRDEFEILINQMEEWHRRWATGTYMIWYPIKESLPTYDFEAELFAGPFSNVSILECHLPEEEDPGTKLTGCGMAILNTPYTLLESMKRLQPGFEQVMNFRIEIKE